MGWWVEAPEGFADFVAARSPSLLRTAWLLTGDSHLAEDLVQTALAKAWPRWGSLRRRDSPEVYVRRVMVNTYATWWRRRWRKEVPTQHLPEHASMGDVIAEVDVRESVRSALATLTRGQRMVVVLRYFDDLTEAQTAALLGCSVGTVKSQAARAIAALRSSAQLAALVVEADSGGER
jgi:RNA polymerase sigma-70 factor (sigma-E family)